MMTSDELKAQVKQILREIAAEKNTPEPPAPAVKVAADPLAGVTRFEQAALQKPGGKDKLVIKRNEYGDYYWQIEYANPKTAIKDTRQHRLHWTHQLEIMLLAIQEME